MSTVPLLGVNSRFYSAIPFSCFSLKMSRFFWAYFRVRKMHSMRSFQRQVELRRLGNQLPVLGKANSLFKLVKCCVFCLFVRLWLSPHCVGPWMKISRVIVARAKSMYRTDLYSVAPPGGGKKILTPAFQAFSSAMSSFFVRWCWHLWEPQIK